MGAKFGVRVALSCELTSAAKTVLKSFNLITNICNAIFAEFIQLSCKNNYYLFHHFVYSEPYTIVLNCLMFSMSFSQRSLFLFNF